MDENLDLEELTAPLRDDTRSGAAEIARIAADVMRGAADTVDAPTLEELRDGLARAALAVLAAQPAMAPLVALVTAVLEAAEAVWNHYFELLPMGLVASVVTERGALTPSELVRFRRGLRLPEEIRAWAAAPS